MVLVGMEKVQCTFLAIIFPFSQDLDSLYTLNLLYLKPSPCLEGPG